MPLPATPLHRNDRGPAVAALHRTLEFLKRTIDPAERDQRLFGPATEQVLLDFQKQAALPATGVFDDATRAAITNMLRDVGPLSVFGQLTGADGAPIAGASVSAVDLDLFASEPLGDARTDSGGEYEIRYGPGKFARAEKGSADLVVRATIGDAVLAQSPTLFNPPAEARVDLLATARRGPSELEQLQAALAPLLGGVAPEKLTAQHVPFLAGETGLPAEQWAALVGALSLRAAAPAGTPLEACYAWQRTGQPATWIALAAVPIPTLRAALLQAIDRNLVPAGLRDAVDAVLARIPSPARDVLTGVVGAAVGGDVAKAVLGHLDAVTDAALTALVDQKVVSASDAARVGLAASLHQLLDVAPAMLGNVLDTTFATLPGGRLQQAADLTALDPADWASALDASGAKLPAGVSRDAFARSLALEVAGAFPEAALRQRAARAPDSLEASLKQLRPLLARRKDALQVDFDAVATDVAPADREAVRTAHASVRTLANLHPGLKLAEALAGGAADAAQTVATRVGWVSEVLARNPGTRFLEFDYLPGSPSLATLDFGKVPDAERPKVLADLRALRRMHAVTGNVVSAQELMAAGFHSASAIARTPRALLAARTGRPAPEARAIQKDARALANDAAMRWFGIYDVTRDQAIAKVQVIPTRQQFFRPLDGFAALLQDEPWCSCDRCQSVLGPAAYFVDLMHWVEEQILADSFADQPTHPLHLARRRPDLWDGVPLSCAATDTVVPTLDLVNEILQRYLHDVLPLPAGTTPTAWLATQEGSLRQPFTYPLERLDVLLGHFQLSRHAVARAMRAPRAVLARTRLGLSLRAYGLVTTDRSALVGYLGRLFGIVTNIIAADTVLAPVELAALVRTTGVARDPLAAALQSAFVAADGSAVAAVAIVLGRRSPDDVQNNTETVTNLTFHRLDRLHRFLRLWRTLPWTVAELDWALGRFAPAGGRPGLDPDATGAPGSLERLVPLLELQDAWGIPLDDLLAICDAFPDRGLRDPTPLFDRLFNAPAFVERDGAWTAQTAVRFTHPAWHTVGAAGVSSPPDATLARVLAGLQLSDPDFLALVAGLRAAPDLDYRPGDAATNESIALSRASIAVLYRHARVRTLLGYTVADFLGLLQLAPRGPGQGPLGLLRGAEDVRALVAFAAWQRAGGRSVAELTYLTGGPPPADAPDPAALAQQVPALIAAAGDAAGRAAILAGPDPLALLDVALGGLLVRSPDELGRLRACTATLPPAQLAGAVRAMQGQGDAADLALLTELVAAVLRFHRLLPRPAYDSDGLQFVRAQRTLFFGPPPVGGAGELVTIEVVRRVTAYAGLAGVRDAGFSTAALLPDVGALRAVLLAIGTATAADLARALRADAAQVAALTPHLALPQDPFDALALIGDALALAGQLGVSGETLARMIDESNPATTFDQLDRAAADVLGAFRAKYPDAATFAAKIEGYEDLLRGRLRDGLVDALVTRWPTPFSDPSKLYEYFLIDVQVEGCARTSRIVAATASVQLYVHRVLMNLEHSLDWDGTIPPAKGVVARFSDPDRRAEWSWRQHYRVWEANRRVFLYPENYLEPELRDDKTPLFKELEDTLLAQDLTPANVQDAFSRYLTGFDGLARLQIAGAYRDAATATLHLFGVTQDDAPAYFYRAVDESGSAPRFSAWQPVPLQIPVRKVSPFLLDGRLYLFWLETATRPINTFSGGSSNFSGYRHSVRLKCSTLRLDGAWTAPQIIRFAEGQGVADARIVEDPRDTHIVDQMKQDRAALEATRPDLEDEKTKADQALHDAVQNYIAAGEDEASKKADLDAPLTLAQGFELAGLIGVGIPPDAAYLIVKSVANTAYQLARATTAAALEVMSAAADRASNAQSRLDQLDQQEAALDAAIAAEQIHVRWDRSLRDHKDALDSYKPDGWAFDRPYPEAYAAPRPDLPAGAKPPIGIRLTVAPFDDVPPPPGGVPIHSGDLDPVAAVLREPAVTETPAAQGRARLNWTGGRLQLADTTLLAYPGEELVTAAYFLEQPALSGPLVATAPASSLVQVVGGQLDSAVLETEGDAVWMRQLGGSWLGLRLGTSLTRALVGACWTGGPALLLDAQFQLGLAETRSRITSVAGQADEARRSPFHPEHPCLVYFRETFLHIPFSLAAHLNGTRDFAGAQRWYQTIFDPTAADGNAWRNRELASPDLRNTTLRQILTDEASLAAYRADPFNPWAIARTRMTAYAKAIVMRYVDNLLDWGDDLFAQFTMESVNEATMLYTMAADILGPRPAALGPCGKGDDAAAPTYGQIRDRLTTVSDFLVELETPSAPSPGRGGKGGPRLVLPASDGMVALRAAAPLRFAAAVPLAVPVAATDATAAIAANVSPRASLVPVTAQTPQARRELLASHTVWAAQGGTPLAALRAGAGPQPGAALTVAGSAPPPAPPGGGAAQVLVPGSAGARSGQAVSPFDDQPGSWGLARQDLVPGLKGGDLPVGRGPGMRFGGDPLDVVPPADPLFCIPPNADLLAYWDRVANRLFKIRNCMDMAGVRRRLDLFAPEIDPRLLVRMTAAGLSIDDVLAVTAGQLPPYRFGYLIEKAKQHAGTVQAFGAQLLAALEKGDAEDLNQLRTVHEQNLLQMRRKLTSLEIDAAEDTLASLRAQRDAVEYRRQHFLDLRVAGNLPQEAKQQQLQREAAQYRTAAGIAQVVASILTIIPDFGAPTAMKFGGSQLGAAGRAVGEGLGAVAAFNDTAAAMAGVGAATQRREQEWAHQQETARRELAQLDQSIAAAGIRRDIAARALEVHEQSVTQTEELFELFRTRFASADRYRLLAKDLRRLYRLAYNSALGLARLAEQAYAAERDDVYVLDGAYWDASSGGLYAGERMLIDLERMEHQFVEQNVRKLEVEHAFSLAQLAPDRLDDLRLTGECTFDVPEWFFDLSYPGQYRRRLRAVRLTMPCVTGPYASVGATLRLEKSQIRLAPPADATQPLDPLVTVPQRGAVVMATSKAQYDAGVLDFSFRDERYLPFEGAGAISSWRLTLPRTLRTFDYDTITDVVLHLSYTADRDEGLAQRWDTMSKLVGLLAADGTDGQPPLVRRLSLRDEFPDAFHRLVASPPGTEVAFTVDARHFAVFLAGRALEARTASLALVTPLASFAAGARPGLGLARQTTPPLAYADVTAPVSPTGGLAGGLREFDCGSVLAAPPATAGVSGSPLGDYVIRVSKAGGLAAGAGNLDPALVHDVVLRIGYRLAAGGA